MKNCLFVLFIMSIPVKMYCQGDDVLISFNKPAASFTEAAPLGNGRIGALVFGNTKMERIALNEISLWSGGPQDADRDSAYQYLPAIQQALLNGDNATAQRLLLSNFTCKGDGSGLGQGANVKYGSYQTMGDVLINNRNGGAIANYNRTLNLENALAVTTYNINRIAYKQEVFTDFINDVIWIKLQSERARGINVDLSLYRKENLKKKYYKEGKLIMYGQLPAGNEKGMEYATVMQPVFCDGKIKSTDSLLSITGATTCIIAVAMRTNYDNLNGSLLRKYDVINSAVKDINNVAAIPYTISKKKSIVAYQKMFNTCRWTMPQTIMYEKNRDTQSRLVTYAAGGSDNQLPVLYFNYGRYLLISSSRKGSLPANLQGLWAVEYQAPWNADYHLNINLQMNYWLAEVTGLASNAEPLFQYTKNLVHNGEKTSKAYYNAPGWVAHVITNPWFFTSPGEGAEWGSTLTGGAWLATHIWEHYLFTKDENFLKQYYPVLKGAAQFLKSILIKEKVHGWLVTAPSNSPENTYIMPDGFKGNTCMGPTMDMQICRNIFTATAAAANILNIDKNLSAQMHALIGRLAPVQISKINGGIQEWLDDWPALEPQHRHISHLFGLHPYDEITPWDTPDLATAAKHTLQLRGDGGTGWSKAWKICFWARLGDGNHAYKMFRQLMSPVTDIKESKFTGGTYPNLMDAHPPFQIDGNFGAVAGIAEMLLQSHGKNNVIRFLPALPKNKEWAKGKIRGLVGRGGVVVDMAWENGRLINASVHANCNNEIYIQLPKGKEIANINPRHLLNKDKNGIELV